MRAKTNRPINYDEIHFVRTALERCAVTTNVEKHVSSVSSLRVVDQCQCGCPSVDFARTSSQAPQLVADGLGITVNGDRVGIIVWGVQDSYCPRDL